MKDELKKHITKGPARTTAVHTKYGHFSVATLERVICYTVNKDASACHIDVEQANAELIAEAFTVFSRTNKTPGELEERIQKLESAVRKISNASNAQVDEYMVSAQLEECGTIADEALHP